MSRKAWWLGRWRRSRRFSATSSKVAWHVAPPANFGLPTDNGVVAVAETAEAATPQLPEESTTRQARSIPHPSLVRWSSPRGTGAPPRLSRRPAATNILVHRFPLAPSPKARIVAQPRSNKAPTNCSNLRGQAARPTHRRQPSGRRRRLLSTRRWVKQQRATEPWREAGRSNTRRRRSRMSEPPKRQAPAAGFRGPGLQCRRQV